MNSGPVRYVKGHGTQNDFVLLPDPEGSIELTADLVRALCDRRAGIGGDGVLRVVRTALADPAMAGEAIWYMDHRNANGSLAEMCGNGLRLFALFLVHSGRAQLGEQHIGTRAGVRRAVVRADDTVSVEMGPAVMRGSTVARLGGQDYPGTVVSMGNPHLVCVTSIPVTDLDLASAPVADGSVFPSGVNIEFVNLLDDPVSGADAHVRMRVHERGVGETAACGTGACAVAATALAGSDGTVAVDQPGGRVLVSLDRAGTCLSGPAVIVGSGELDPVWLRRAS
ncbi:MAG: diaminopimelate epimerase [Geodermatophilaceae bacterium]|nr:diaminopimelate epimerase [Geodermatophilaceae bacterium]